MTDQSTSAIAHSPLEKASLLNSFFCAQTVLPGATTTAPDVSSLPQNERSFDTLRTTPREVYTVLSKLKAGKAPGHDGIPPCLLRLCASGISSSLATMFNVSFGTGTFPADWKKAVVIPVHKKGACDLPGNYRPIALLPIVSKVMERLAHDKLSQFLKPWFAPNQSGFKKKDGTTPQLLRLTQTWADAVDSGCYVGSVFFDLRKAFDRVWHRGLLSKLQAAGISGAAYHWFADFLNNRVQATSVDGCLSAFSPLHAGVPQGAILSPLLFSIYMNDIPFPDSTNLFADDTSSFVVDSSPGSLCLKLQERTDGLCSWFSKWLLSVNSAKSAVMVFRSRKMCPVDVSQSPHPPFRRCPATAT